MMHIPVPPKKLWGIYNIKHIVMQSFYPVNQTQNQNQTRSCNKWANTFVDFQLWFGLPAVWF